LFRSFVPNAYRHRLISFPRGVHMEVFPGISMDPKVRFGKPCIAGTRNDVATVIGLLASGSTTEESKLNIS
jgi:uncharacterized protein (DUF433 family)